MIDQKNPLKVLFVSTEVAPYATVGGLSQVMYFLPKELKKLGVDARIFLPKYGTLDEKKYHLKLLIKNLRIPTDEITGVKELICNVKVRSGRGVEPTVYFLENMEYYEKRANVYGYADDPIRFALLSRGVLEFLKNPPAGGWIPDVVHSNDWHTGYLGNYLRTTYKNDTKLKSLATLLTIHNLAHQGVMDFRYATPLEQDDGRGELPALFSLNFKKRNALKRGIIYADIVNTVSERYSREIMTPQYGHGLNDLLKQVRAKVYGVLNGIDYHDFNPATDKLIRYNFSRKHFSLRAQNKTELQKEFNLPVDPSIPILAMCNRLHKQKGLDLVIKVLPYILEEYALQFIVLGGGEAEYKEFFTRLEETYPEKVATHLISDWQLPRKIFAGTDMLLLPSKFEPGGIAVIEGMRYGTVPVVRATGGLADIVTDFDIEKSTGNGFVFDKYSEYSLLGAVTRALETYKQKRIWQGLAKRTMEADFSWETSAKKYVDLYNRAIVYRKEALAENPAEAFRK